MYLSWKTCESNDTLLFQIRQCAKCNKTVRLYEPKAPKSVSFSEEVVVVSESVGSGSEGWRSPRNRSPGRGSQKDKGRQQLQALLEQAVQAAADD